MIWFTSDTHFNHANIIKYSNRPFKSVEEMNQTIIDNWVSVVKPEDTVYFLGDFAMGQNRLHESIFKQLTGDIVLIKGNHDSKSVASYLKMGFKGVSGELWVQIEETTIYLRHRPESNVDRWQAHYHFCGHVHEAWARKGNIINVGVDVRGFKPRSADELTEPWRSDIQPNIKWIKNV